eukprot:gene18725-biopygen11410
MRKIKTLQAVTEEQVGLELLNLFLMDLLDRDSPAGKIFESKIDEDFEGTRVVRFSSKVVAGIVLVLMNVLFAYYSMFE